MRVKVISTIALGLVLQAIPDDARAQSGEDNNVLAAILSSVAESLEASANDEAIRRAYRDVVGRDPSDRELRRYRVKMHEDYWNEDDIREDLRERSDYRRPSRHSIEDPDRIIHRAYEDILHREPDAEGLRLYRSRMIDDDWTEHDVREALKESPEHGEKSQESADKVIRRAYEDVLGREPDYNGLVSYRNKILDHGWTEHDVREALRNSPEYRQKNAITQSEAEEIVRRAYHEVLDRDLDAGSRGYVEKVLRDHWSEQDVARELRHSDEYRNKHRRRQ